jgi:serine phosphatase RsbU (regulator of sigma subunit)
VSGDFYWTHEINNTIFIAAADCTGHGVPGAFMSLLGFIMLNDIVKTIENASPAEILTEVNTQLMNTLHQDGEHSTGKFGMDIALIKYNKLTKELIFAGAHNPLVIINESGINELKSDKVAIGTIKTTSFNNQTVQVKEGDMIYIYSDGYPDQIGGEKRKKFLSFNMKELFVQIHTMNMDQQKSELEKKHMEWRSKTDQTDDILIIGLKV